MSTNNVVRFDFNNKREIKFTDHRKNTKVLNGKEYDEPQTGWEYLMICKEVLQDKEYRDILCGIIDPEIYDSLQEEYKNIIQRFLKFED